MGEFLNQPSFAAGEIAPDLYGRVDQELYYIGARTILNFIVRQYGGAANRPGTEFIAEVKDSTKNVRLIPFQFNEEQTYVIELGDESMRIIADGGQITEAAKNITGITQANPAVVTSNSHGFENGQHVYIASVVGMTELNGRSFKVANKTGNTFELQDYQGNNINSTSYTAYSSGGTASRIYTVDTPWDHEDLFELNYTQSNDVLTATHNDYYPQDVTRTGNAAWTVDDFANEEGPFKQTNTTATTISANGVAVGATVTLTASAALFDSSWVGELLYLEEMPNAGYHVWEAGKGITATNVRRAGPHYYAAQNTATTGTVRPDHTEGEFYDGDAGVLWRYLHSGFGIVEITGYTDSTHVTATVIKRLPDVNVSGTFAASDIWARGAWSETEGYPGAVTYHKQRMVFAGTRNQPQGMWFSNTGARISFARSNPILDDESISLLLDTNQVNAIRHLLPLSELVVLTSASEQSVNGADNLILATDPPIAKVQGYTGSSKVIPVIIGNTALFVNDYGTEIRNLRFDFGSDSYSGVNLAARSPHLFRFKSIKDIAFQREPLSIIWCVMDDGTLNGFTYMEEQKVYAWHRHETDGLFESVCTIREGDETAVYFVVKRTINGVTKKYIERLSSRYFEDIVDAFFVDCGTTYDGRNTGATTITITGGVNWDSPETLTLTASSSMFKSTDVGDKIIFRYTNDDGVEIRLPLTISAYTSGTVVSAIPSKLVPASHRSAARSDWEFARDTFRPLHHLEGKEVAVLADGNVVEGITVTGGVVTLPEHASVVHIGLPYTSTLETLDMAQPQGQTKAKSINVPRVFLTVQESRAVFVATNKYGSSGDLVADGFYEVKQRDPGLGYDAAIPAQTDIFEIVTNTAWSNKGRIAIKQPKPLPITINCITPEITGGYS